MINSGIGPIINKQRQSQKKKPINPMTLARYSMYQANNQYRAPMGNVPPLQTNTLNIPRKEMGNFALIQQHASNLKNDLNALTQRKLESPLYSTQRETSLSPNSERFTTSRMEPESRVDQLKATLSSSENIINQASPQVSSDFKSSSNFLSKMGDKEYMKTTELMTLSLKVGLRSLKNCKIVTKINYTKKQMIWETSDVKSGSKESSKNKMPFKKKFEVQFSDINRIDINTIRNSLIVETKEKPQEYREYLPHSSKKHTQTFKESNFDSDIETEEGTLPMNGKFIVQAIYPKDTFTKATPGKYTLLEKLLKSDLPVWVNGKLAELPNESSIKFPKLDDPFQNKVPTPQKQSLSQLLRGAPTNDNFGFPSLDLSFPSTQNFKTSTSQKDSFKIPHSDSDKMLEELPTKDNLDIEEEDDEENEFPLLTREKKAEIKKFENQLTSMKQEEKTELILETIKPKKFGLNPNAKKTYKCPIYKCNFQKSSPQLLKQHLNQKHKSLVDAGFGVDDSGVFNWKPEALDFVLLVTKIYPTFVKNIVRESKLD